MLPGVVKVNGNPRVCQGCRACEAVCSAYHYGEVNPKRTGIRIYEQEELGKFKQIVCQQCIDMPCAAVCPENAIARNSYSGAVEIKENCTGCGSCAEACPIEAIWIAAWDSTKKAIKCDLCGGMPQCVPVCPRQSLGW